MKLNSVMVLYRNRVAERNAPIVNCTLLYCPITSPETTTSTGGRGWERRPPTP